MSRPKIRSEAAQAAADRSLAAKWSRVRFRDNRDPATTGDVIAAFAGDCWCGEPFGHPWPGKADGAPHPRGGAA